MIRSTVRQFRLATRNLPAMVRWYARVFGMAPRHSTSASDKILATSRFLAAWSSNHPANPRITILSLSGLTMQTQQSLRQRHHIIFECSTLDDLLAAYVRLKGLGIEPIHSVHHGAGATFYYEDPDQNVVELTLDNQTHLQNSEGDAHAWDSSEALLLGTHVDPEKMIAAREAGTSVAEVHELAYAGEFRPLESMSQTEKVCNIH